MGKPYPEWKVQIFKNQSDAPAAVCPSLYFLPIILLNNAFIDSPSAGFV
jgi:hypothetical protein